MFSPKGGVGRTTVAVNLAVAAATELGKKVVLVDGSFQFGDVGVLLNLNPKNKSIADLVPELEQAGHEVESIDTFVINHSAGIRVLLAPPSPEMAELITPAGIRRVIEALRLTHELVIVDCTAFFNDTTLAILDSADTILTMLSLEITSIKNMRLFLEVADQLGYDGGKVRLILNRADSALGIKVDGRRAFDRPQGRRDHRQRRAERGLRLQSRRPVLPQQSGGAGLPGHPPAGTHRHRRAGAGRARHRGRPQGRTEEIVVRMALIVVTDQADQLRPSGREGV